MNPTSFHSEEHFTGSATVRDLVIGTSDGLTVPFALAAGLSGAVLSNNVIVTAGFAEIAAGSIAMGLGGYLAAKSEEEHYAKEMQREKDEVIEKPEVEAKEVQDIFESYGLSPEESQPVVAALRKRKEDWIKFMMRFELGLEKPDPKRALQSAFTIGGAYVAGGLIPLAPYMVLPEVHAGFRWSVLVTLTALFAFGYLKGRVTGIMPWRSALQTVIIGGLAAAAAFLIARAVS